MQLDDAGHSEGVENMKFGMTFKVLVWCPAVPHPYQRIVRFGEARTSRQPLQAEMHGRSDADCLREFTGPTYEPTGVFDNDFYGSRVFFVQNGMVPSMHCHHQTFSEQQGSRPEGWPCPLGGSIGLTQQAADPDRLVNCMIFYNVPGPPPISDRKLGNRLARFDGAVTKCTSEQRRIEDPGCPTPIDLTALAVCIEGVYPDRLSASFGGRKMYIALRGLAVIPCFTPDAELQGSGYELVAPHGQMIEKRTDGIAFEDLNVLPLSLCYVAMMTAARG